jgi:hypothetical protein
MRYCYFISNHKPELAKEVLGQLHANEDKNNENKLSSLVVDIQKRLERNGYTVRTSIGIGNYSINLAIYDEETSSYKLGIICDIEDVKTLNARRDLVHQEKYLRSRNWTIYRIFASNWYTDQNKEMRNIRDFIK